MRFFVRQIFPIAVVAATLLALQACAPKPQEDCGYVQNSYGQRISWKGRVPVQIYLHSSFPDKFRPALQNAMATWETAAGRKLFQIAGVVNSANEGVDGKNIIFWNTTWENERRSEQARTAVYWEGAEIREADMKVNNEDFTFYDGSPNSSRDVHLQSLIEHELGHVLGMKHREGDGGVMAASLASVTERSTLAAADKVALKCEY